MIQTKRLTYGAVTPGANEVLKALDACCQEQRKAQGFDATAFEKRSLAARDISTIYRNEVRSKTMELDAEGMPIPGINPDFLMAPLEAATDADNLGTLAGTLVGLRYLDIFMYKLPLIAKGKIMTDFSDEPGYLNQATSTRKVVVPPVISFDPTLDTDGYPKGWAPVRLAPRR